jgi:hypothetical protein
MYKTLFLPVSSNGDQSPALAFAAALTQSFAAKAESTFVSKSLVLLQEDEHAKVANVYRTEGLAASQELTEALYKEQFKKRATAVKEWFARTTSSLGSAHSLIWQDTLDVFGETAEQIRNKCSVHDMTIVSADISASIWDTLLEGALFATGRPLVLVRAFTAGKTLADSTIMLAWKQSPQTLRAQWFALPLLQKAKRVVVTHVQEGDAAEDIQGVLRTGCCAGAGTGIRRGEGRPSCHGSLLSFPSAGNGVWWFYPVFSDKQPMQSAAGALKEVEYARTTRCLAYSCH